MTPELTAQLDARISVLISELTPAQQAHVLEHGRYLQTLSTVDVGWTGQGTLRYEVTEYFGPSEIDGVDKAGAVGTAIYTDIDGADHFKTIDFGTQPSRNIDWS